MTAHPAFPNHGFDALDAQPRVLEERIGGMVMVLEKHPENGPITLLTAGVSKLPTDSGEAVELAVEVLDGQQGAGLVALRIVCDDIAVSPSGVPGNVPVFLSKLHAEHPPRWVTFTGQDVQSVTGLESEEYMADAANHEIWAVDSFAAAFPFVADFLRTARAGQTALFVDDSGQFTLEDD